MRKDRFLSGSTGALRNHRAPCGRATGARLFHEPGRLCAGVRARRRGKVTAVEASARKYCAAARRNAERNGLQVEWIEQDVFSFLRAAEKDGREFDLIILDPPSFTKTKGGLRDAVRGYHELHVRAFKLLSKDGLLATFSCSYHVSETIFNQTIAGCARRRAAIGPPFASLRTGTRSSGSADDSGDRILQRCFASR